MEYIADLHLHSKYAMACSEQLTLENMDAAAREKGIKLIVTGDFTHPMWLDQLKSRLAETSEGSGVYSLKGSSSGTRFMLSTEVCTIFEDRSGKARKIHHVVFAPDLQAAQQANAALAKYGDLSSDGRPILNGLNPAGLVEELMGVSKDMFVFPAHIWTPWFGVLGAFSGFDSMEEAYEDQARNIHAYETGLSSDPPMNWTVSKLDKYTLISGSDAHSLPKMGREAVVLNSGENEITYRNITGMIKHKEIKLTIEFYPEEGKYHFDGHRNCNISLSPEESRKYNDRCPKCAKRLTIGVMHRVMDLSDREPGEAPQGAAPYAHAIPLQEVIAYVTKKGTGSTYVKATYSKLVERFGSEFNVLLKSDIGQIAEIDKDLARAIETVRQDKAHVIPGYDGNFGIVDIFNEAKESRDRGTQKRISEF